MKRRTMKSSNEILYPIRAAIVFLAVLGACADPESSGRPTMTREPGEQEPGHGEHEQGVVELTAEAVARAGIVTAPVTERVLEGELSTTGQVDFDQTRLAHVSPRITGRVHRVYAVLGQDVRGGDTLAEIDPAIPIPRAAPNGLGSKPGTNRYWNSASAAYRSCKRIFTRRVSIGWNGA